MGEFRMPSLGADMEAGTVVEWKVAPGDVVRRGDIVLLVETDKGLVEVETFESGVVESIVVPAGARVPCGTLLATLRPAGTLSAPGPAPTPAAAPPRGRVSPAARVLAQERGVDLAGVRGTGPDGAITRGDVERAAASSAPAAAGSTDRAAAMRRAIAAAMARSKRDIPHYYLGTTIDLHRAVAWLAAENARRSVTARLLAPALLLRAVARAVREVPEMNGFWVDGQFRAAEAVHVGVAIALRQGGLVAPAIHDVDRKGVDEVMQDMLDLVARVRAGTVRGSELADATITVTSLGEQGAETVFGVIYPPQVALVGFGRIVERPWAAGGAVTVRPTVAVTLAADHRASDGHRGGRFLAAVDRLLQRPEAL